MRHITIGSKSIRIILIIIAISLVAVIAVQNLAAWEQKRSVINLNTSGYTSYIFPTPSKIQSGSQAYVENKELITIMLLGIDTPGKTGSSGSYNNDQQADFLALLVIDPDTNDGTLIHINRDTMADITVLGVTGQAAGTTYGQVALAHTYGSGLQDSCINTADAISRLFYGITIDYYLSINMDAVAIINDQIGGVVVTVEDDFSKVDSKLVKGETITLTGEHALNFVRARQGMDDPTNLSRMKRQKQYISNFLDQFQDKINSKSPGQENLILDLYRSISAYLVTNCPLQTFSQLANRLMKITQIKTKMLTGTAEKGAEFIEFHPDKDQLFELTMDTFFKKSAS